MKPIQLPHPDEIRRGIDACEREMRALRRLLRTCQDAYDADAARRLREGKPLSTEGVRA
ncbi:MAG TPA: hypothetical protein VMG10_32870 [Gemmataceae bacterium]|nr:hypothetical protein [Gemmataceae bacterium]